MKPIRILCCRVRVDRSRVGRRRVAGREQPLRFLHALQENGYGDMAVEYLKMLAKQPDLPPEVRDVWDLEMSKSLKAAAADAFDAKEYEALMDESQKYLAKFIKEKPDHPDADDRHGRVGRLPR